MKHKDILFIIARLLLCWIYPIALHAQLHEETEYTIPDTEEEGRLPDQDLHELNFDDRNHNRRPIDLNQARLEDIESLPDISPIQAQAIYSYVIRNRPVRSALELQTIQQLGLDQLRKWLPHFRADYKTAETAWWKSVGQKGNGQALMRWSRRFTQAAEFVANDSMSNEYYGSADHVFIKFRSSVGGRYSLSWMFEKDPGEAWYSRSHKGGLDFQSAHLLLEQPTTWLDKLVLGDYTLRLGQGLVIDNGFSLGRGSDFGTWVKSPSRIQAFQSVRESAMLRGIAAQARIAPRLKALAFFSSNRLDASLDSIYQSETQSSELRFRSIDPAGLHRNASERLRQNRMRVQLAGTALDYAGKALNAGLHLVRSAQEYASDRAQRRDQLFIPNVPIMHFASLHHRWIRKNSCLFGEGSLDFKGHMSVLQTLMVSFGKHADALWSYCYFDPGFFSSWSRVTSASGTSWNERGYFFGINLRVGKRFAIHGSADFTRPPWLRYQEDLIPRSGRFGLRLHYSEKRKWQVYGQFKWHRESFVSIPFTAAKEQSLQEKTTRSLRLHLETSLLPSLRWRCRMEWQWHFHPSSPTSGFLMYHDLLYRSMESKWSGNVRLALFDIDGFDTRIYAFENDVSFQNNWPSFQGSGMRLYTNLRFRTSPSITLEARFSGTFSLFEQNGKTASSGTYDPPGYDVKLQFQYRF